MKENLALNKNEVIINKELCGNLIRLITDKELKDIPMYKKMDLMLIWNKKIYRNDKDYNLSFITDGRFIKKEMTFDEMLNENNGKISCALAFPKIFIYDDFFERLSEYSIKYLDFDFNKFSKDNNIDIMYVYLMFAIFHETGHLIHYFYELERYGYPKSMQEEYFNPRETKGFFSYRQLETENVADKFAVYILNRFTKDIKHYIKMGCIK